MELEFPPAAEPGAHWPHGDPPAPGESSRGHHQRQASSVCYPSFFARLDGARRAPMKRRISFHETVLVLETHAAEDYDRSSVDMAVLTRGDIDEVLDMRRGFLANRLACPPSPPPPDTPPPPPFRLHAPPSPTPSASSPSDSDPDQDHDWSAVRAAFAHPHRAPPPVLSPPDRPPVPAPQPHWRPSSVHAPHPHAGAVSVWEARGVHQGGAHLPPVGPGRRRVSAPAPCPAHIAHQHAAQRAPQPAPGWRRAGDYAAHQPGARHHARAPSGTTTTMGTAWSPSHPTHHPAPRPAAHGLHAHALAMAAARAAQGHAASHAVPRPRAFRFDPGAAAWVPPSPPASPEGTDEDSGAGSGAEGGEGMEGVQVAAGVAMEVA